MSPEGTVTVGFGIAGIIGALLINVIIVTRFLTRLEARIEAMSAEFSKIIARVEEVEEKFDKFLEREIHRLERQRHEPQSYKSVGYSGDRKDPSKTP